MEVVDENRQPDTILAIVLISTTLYLLSHCLFTIQVPTLSLVKHSKAYSCEPKLFFKL